MYTYICDMWFYSHILILIYKCCVYIYIHLSIYVFLVWFLGYTSVWPPALDYGIVHSLTYLDFSLYTSIYLYTKICSFDTFFHIYRYSYILYIYIYISIDVFLVWFLDYASVCPSALDSD